MQTYTLHIIEVFMATAYYEVFSGDQSREYRVNIQCFEDSISSSGDDQPQLWKCYVLESTPDVCQ